MVEHLCMLEVITSPTQVKVGRTEALMALAVGAITVVAVAATITLTNNRRR